MNFFNKESLMALSAFGIGLGGLFLLKNQQKVDLNDESNQDLERLVERERVVQILKTIKYRMKYYHRLAISISRQLESKPEQEKEKARDEFFQKFISNDYKVISKNIAQFEFGVVYEDFTESIDYYINKGDEEISSIASSIEQEFVSNLCGNKTLLAPNHILLANIDKQTAKEIFKEINCYKFYNVIQLSKEFKKQHSKIEETNDFFQSFINIHEEIDNKLLQFLLVEKLSETERNFNIFFELLVYYCENDLEYSSFIRETEIQSILLYERIISSCDDIDFKYIKNLFSNL